MHALWHLVVSLQRVQRIVEHVLREVGNALVRALLQSLDKLLLDGRVDFGGDQRPALLFDLPPLNLRAMSATASKDNAAPSC